MDFSSLISQEIQNKKRKIGEEKDDRDKGEQAEVESNTDDSSNVENKENEHNDNSREQKTPQQHDDSTEGTGDVTQEKISLRIQQKRQRYQEQLQREQDVGDTIELPDITDLTKQSRLYLLVRAYIKKIVAAWAKEEKDKETEIILYETKSDLVLLLYKLRAQKLTNDLLVSLATILYYVQKQDFNKANESYIQLSIGNATWPIGVQYVGIHARSASLRTAPKGANILLDEKTRKWITAIKRLVSYSERNKQQSKD